MAAYLLPKINYLTANSPTFVSFLIALILLIMSYYSSMLKNTNGTNKIITGTGKCITSTDKCMWKHLCDVPNGVKTRSKDKNEPTVRY